MTASGIRIVGLADTDSYVKWAAALLGRVPEGTEAQLLIVETALAVSPTQQRAALAGSGLSAPAVRRIEYTALAAALAALQPDAVLVAARGPVARVLIRLAAELTPRPVIVSGLPGISIPATTAALVHRMQSDLFVLHSRREIRDFTELAHFRGLSQRFALARLPFAVQAPAAVAAGATGIGPAAAGAATAGTDLVFASQARVPHERRERLQIARMLVAAAAAEPAKRVVLKERAVKGEHQTHRERFALPSLLGAFAPVPANLVISTAPMARALDTAEGLVTVSSTAAVESIARGIPLILLDTFGVADNLINPVFVGSGLLAPETAVVAREFRHPTPEWLADNYFHEPGEDDWFARIEQLVAERRARTLPAKAARQRRGGRARDAWERKMALGREDRTASGFAAAAVGIPIRFFVRGMRRAVHVVTRALQRTRS